MCHGYNNRGFTKRNQTISLEVPPFQLAPVQADRFALVFISPISNEEPALVLLLS